MRWVVSHASALLTLVAACGGGTDADPAPSSQAATPPIPSPVASAMTAGTPAGALVIVAENVRFNTDALAAAAGPITIEFVNRDIGVAHDFTLYQSKDDLTNPLAETGITAGPDRQTLLLELAAGVYYYNCQVHPDMEGTLTAR